MTRRCSNPPKCASCFGMYSCISDNNFAISAESFVMEQSSSEWKSGAICLQSRSWLITFPRLLGPTAELSGDGEQKQGITRDVRERARNLFNCFYLFLFPRERQSACLCLLSGEHGEQNSASVVLTEIARHELVVNGNELQEVIRAH